MNELTKLIDDLIACGNKLTETAQALKGHYSAPHKAATPQEPAETYKDVDVRAALIQKTRLDDHKYKADVQALVTKYSTDGSFSGIPAERYPEVMTELEGIGNG